MPDSFEHMPSLAIRMPNGALTSIAGNVDAHHRVAVADLILVQGQVRQTITRLLAEWKPQVVGLSVMTFQRRTAARIIELVRALQPNAKIVVGGYDPSLAPKAYETMNVDFLIRGEGEVTFRNLLRALEQGQGFEEVLGLSYPNGTASAGEWRGPPSQPGCARAQGLHLAGPSGRCCRDLPRLHLRLQLLLHH
jgi:anaerobic magnesium-protoporphyrin IX monomethyl ester cyclase